MHRCLEVNEILDLMLTDLFESAPGPQSRHNLVSAALACHDFLETALDILWKTQASLVPLIKTLPRKRWRERTTGPASCFDNTFELVGTLTSKDQKRFAYYARRIRQLKYLPYAWHKTPIDGCPYDIKIIQLIWATRTSKKVSLFPNLQQLQFPQINHASPCLNIFLETKQVSLSLCWSQTNDNVDALFPEIQKYALNMQELDLGSFLDVERYSRNDSAFSDLVCNMKDLRGLSCGPRTLNAAAIDHLSLLPRLLKLHLPHDSQEILQGLYLNRGNTVIRNTQPFPELQELFIRETKLSSFTSLMKHLRPLQTRELTLQVDNTFNAQDIRESLVALSKESSQCGNVHRIKFKHTRLASRPPFTAKVDKQVLINGSTLHSILSFTNLIALELDILCAFDLGDSDIMSMADAWSRLRRLQLGSLMGWHIPSCITYHGFLHLLLKCLELEHLVFVFDASSNIPSVIIPGQINKNITYLYIGNSRIGTNDCYSVGKLLAMILPNCCGLGGEWLIEQGILDSQKEWLAVQNTMKKCQSSGVATRD